MLNSLQVVGGSVLTLFLMMAAGYLLAKKEMLTDVGVGQLSKTLLYVAGPCLMVNTILAEEYSAETLRKFWISTVVLLAVYAVQILFAQLCFRRSGDDRGVLRFACVYGNIGFMGIPLIQSVMGNAGMLTTLTSIVLFNLFVWTHGIALVAGKQNLSMKKAVLNPGVIAFLVAAVLFALRVKLPGPVASAVSYMGGLNTPLAMMVVGAQLVKANIPELLRDRKLYAVSLVKLVIMPLLIMVVLLPFRLDPVMYLTIVILAGTPAASTTSMFCQLSGRDPSMAARAVSLSTLLSVITLPLVAAVAGMLCGG